MLLVLLPPVLASPTLQVEGFCRLKGSQTGTFAHQGHRLPAWPRGPCAVSMCPTEAGEEGENFRPQLCWVGLRQHLLRHGISLLVPEAGSHRWGCGEHVGAPI